jgi:hypothetical protein
MCKFKTNAERKTPPRRTLQDTWHCFLALLYFDAAFFLFLAKKKSLQKKRTVALKTLSGCKPGAVLLHQCFQNDHEKKNKPTTLFRNSILEANDVTYY